MGVNYALIQAYYLGIVRPHNKGLRGVDSLVVARNHKNEVFVGLAGHTRYSWESLQYCIDILLKRAQRL